MNFIHQISEDPGFSWREQKRDAATRRFYEGTRPATTKRASKACIQRQGRQPSQSPLVAGTERQGSSHLNRSPGHHYDTLEA